VENIPALYARVCEHELILLESSGSVYWWAFVKAIMNFQVPINGGQILDGMSDC
jgi:hypothetical protein